MHTFKGIIALDIDGTITVSKHSLEEDVKNYLNQLIKDGWRLVFLSGRTFSFATPILSSLRGDYFLAVQNGAALYEMPSQKLITKNYVPKDFLSRLDPLFKNIGRGLLVESGKENADVCYYKPSDFTTEELNYIDFRIKLSSEEWVKVDEFENLTLQEFAVGKYFAPEKEALGLAEKILTSLPLSVVVIRDPFRSGFHLAHINALKASKGQILEDFIGKTPPSFPVIAAGDDYNDVEMLEKSVVKIVMKNGPENLHQIADIIAPPADEKGIIQGLKEAIWKVSSK